MSHLEDLRLAHEEAEQRMYALQAEKDAMVAEYGPKMREARDEAAAAQKRYLDASVAQHLLESAGEDGPDYELAERLGVKDSLYALLEDTTG